jgi:hypothetical protein
MMAQPPRSADWTCSWCGNEVPTSYTHKCDGFTKSFVSNAPGKKVGKTNNFPAHVRMTHETHPVGTGERQGTCTVPPEGWHCTREPGHEGPCAAVPDPIVGSASMRDGSRVPVRKSFADAIWAQAEADDQRRREAMPDEASAIRQLWDAHQRLKELGWQEPVYAPKDGSPLDIIELGSTGIHSGYYQGEWPTGSWWVVGGDVWPSRPALARAALAPTRSEDTPNEQ